MRGPAPKGIAMRRADVAASGAPPFVTVQSGRSLLGDSDLPLAAASPGAALELRLRMTASRFAQPRTDSTDAPSAELHQAPNVRYAGRTRKRCGEAVRRAKFRGALRW